MIDRYPPINPKCPDMLHGGDYNPDQWIRTPEVWDQDMRLMKLAGCNAMSVGIFSWVALEPEEGRFEFGWLDTIMDKLADNDAYAVLATPSGARPAWLSQKYPEVLRVRAERLRNLHGTRHNHCFTSPVYREKTQTINRKLAERYKDHPALLVWHVSNEYSGECHCELCRAAFVEWLKAKYENDLGNLNHAWWTAFWSHTYTDWSQIEPPSPLGEGCVHGQNLDWRRFITDQTVSFFLSEIKPLRELTPGVPVTANFMGLFSGLNYWEFARHMDVVSWDNYPAWHRPGGDVTLAADIAFVHNAYRCMKGGKPFMLMESTPSMTNWMPTAKLKRPGMHLLSSLQAVAHGSDTVQYFQWRKSRGCSEKFHGAVVDHVGHENNRVFRDCAQVGDALGKLRDVVGTTVRPDVAIIYDWENGWGINEVAGLGRELKKYNETCMAHYRPFWARGVPVDVIEELCDFSPYKLLIAPMLYMLRPGVAERLRAFVEGGGTLLMTYWSGIVDENDLCFLGGWPGQGLRELFGIWDEETDALYPEDGNRLVMAEGNELGLSGDYEVRDLCALIHAEGATVLATYGEDFYAGRPALTVNASGKGRAFYLAARTSDAFLSDLYARLIEQLGIKAALDAALPAGVTAQMRTDGKEDFVFLMNFNPGEQTVGLGGEKFVDVLAGEAVGGEVGMEPYGLRVLRRRARGK